MAGIELDGANQKVVLDSDGDTYLEAATDDTIKVYVAGAQDFTITANTLTAESGSTIAAQALTATTVTASGIIKTDNATEATSTTDGSLQTDGGLSVVKDTVLGDDLKLLSDSSVVAFGADGDTTLTHTDGTGLTLNSTNKLCFNDATQFIQGASGTVLDIAATDEIELTATLIEAVGRLEVTGGAIFNEASADVDFRIESNGNANMFIVNGGSDLVGIASDPDLGKALHIKIADAGSVTPNTDADEFIIENSASAGMTILTGTSTTGAINFADSGNANAGVFRYDHANDSMDFFTGGSERMNINSSGNLLVNTTSTVFGGNMLQVVGGADAEVVAVKVTTNGKKGIQFANASSTDVGNIVVAASSTAYNTSSDYRLKENVNYNFDATTRLKQLKPARFNWIADDTNTLIDGFLAHEVSSIVPEAVTGTKDELEIYKYYDEIPAEKSLGDNKIDKDGNTIAKHQSIDNSKLIPLLVKTIQELETRVKTLEDA